MKKIQPSDLQTKVNAMKVSGQYDWKKQVFENDQCKWGTNSRTSSQTCSGQFNSVDDNPSDSYTD